MQNKPLLFGLIGFFIGGLLVSVAATITTQQNQNNTANEMSMSQMVESLKDKKGDEFDKAFISEMIAHHESAVEMAKLSEINAQRDEIKVLSRDIITAQEKEIMQMKTWQKDWGYMSMPSNSPDHSSMQMSH